MDSIMSVILFLFNVVHVVFGSLLMAGGIWFFIEIQNLTDLRNTNRYQLKSELSWTESVPWIFIMVGLSVVLISLCGCTGAAKKSRSFFRMFITFEIIVVVMAMSAVAVTLIFANSDTTDWFIKDTMQDAINNIMMFPKVKKAYGEMEQRLHCCGAVQSRDYVSYMTSFPPSCCEDPNGGIFKGVCSFNDPIANSRHGCIKVIEHYARKFVLWLCAGAGLAGVVGIINIIITIFLLTTQRQRKDKNTYEETKVPIN